VKQLNANADVPNTAGQYVQWKSLPVTQNEYVHEIYRSVPCAVKTEIFRLFYFAYKLLSVAWWHVGHRTVDQTVVSSIPSIVAIS